MSTSRVDDLRVEAIRAKKDLNYLGLHTAAALLGKLFTAGYDAEKDNACLREQVAAYERLADRLVAGPKRWSCGQCGQWLDDVQGKPAVSRDGRNLCAECASTTGWFACSRCCRRIPPGESVYFPLDKPLKDCVCALCRARDRWPHALGPEALMYASSDATVSPWRRYP